MTCYWPQSRISVQQSVTITHRPPIIEHMVHGPLSLSKNNEQVMTVLSNEHPPAGLMRCISTAAQAEQELDRIATRTTGATQREAEQRVQEILEQVRRDGDQALISSQSNLTASAQNLCASIQACWNKPGTTRLPIFAMP